MLAAADPFCSKTGLSLGTSSCRARRDALKTNGGEFTYGGAGVAELGPEGNSFRHRHVSASHSAAQPRAVDDIVRWVSCHLRRDVPLSYNITLDNLAAFGARRRFPRADLHHPARLWSRRLLPVATGQRYSRQPVQPDDSDAICLLAAAACTAPRFMEQSGPAGAPRS